MIFLFNCALFWFHVNFLECIHFQIEKSQHFSILRDLLSEWLRLIEYHRICITNKLTGPTVKNSEGRQEVHELPIIT